ncbi:MAG: nickel pincer cofactor biosynthesis protein LarB [Planctomycetales bacterium]|nr:nickel pincer cofactor biosynthesis protein LarB [Planctomycetales bacterium]
MDLHRLIEQFTGGELSREGFVQALLRGVSADLDEVTLDIDRRRRCGYPEVVYAEGKTVAAIEKIFARLLAEGMPALATRVSREQADALAPKFAECRYNEVARTLRIGGGRETPLGQVAVVTAGTSDLPVAEEARETLDWMGVATAMIHDVGVAGPHRLPAHLTTLSACDAVVVVAGMEGALPSVVGGYVACPVVAVPTSVGYGAAFGGVAALLGMLNSCASNVTVVNIDAGFKAGYVAGLIAQRGRRA